MSVYSSGSVSIKVGSAIVRGSTDVNFTSNVTAGNLFKINYESTWYEVASINTATKLTLNSRYSNSGLQTSRDYKEASIGNATNIYSGTLNYTPVIQNTVVLNASRERFTDDGAGVLTGDQGGSGTVGYDDGAWSVTLGTTLTATRNLTASYFSGDLITGMSYQIFRDYTPNYEWPEQNIGDQYLEHIYTKAIRLIDSDLYNASVNTIKAASDIQVTATMFGLIQKSPDGTQWRLRIDDSGSVTATKV